MQRTISRISWRMVIALLVALALLTSCGVTKKTKSKETIDYKANTAEKSDSNSVSIIDTTSEISEQETNEDDVSVYFYNDTIQPDNVIPVIIKKEGSTITIIPGNQKIKSVKAAVKVTSTNTEKQNRKTEIGKSNSNEKTTTVQVKQTKSGSEKSKWNFNWWIVVIVLAFFVGVAIFLGWRPWDFITTFFKPKNKPQSNNG
jgi:hypothetical protein